MKNLFTSLAKNLKSNANTNNNQANAFDFAQPGLSRNQIAALKGGEDTTTEEDIIITDIIGG